MEKRRSFVAKQDASDADTSDIADTDAAADTDADIADAFVDLDCLDDAPWKDAAFLTNLFGPLKEEVKEEEGQQQEDMEKEEEGKEEEEELEPRFGFGDVGGFEEVFESFLRDSLVNLDVSFAAV